MTLLNGACAVNTGTTTKSHLSVHTLQCDSIINVDRAYYRDAYMSCDRGRPSFTLYTTFLKVAVMSGSLVQLVTYLSDNLD